LPLFAMISPSSGLSGIHHTVARGKFASRFRPGSSNRPHSEPRA